MIMYEARGCVSKSKNLTFLIVSDTGTGVWLKDIISKGFRRALKLPLKCRKLFLTNILLRSHLRVRTANVVHQVRDSVCIV